jgi:hypothetical protein
MDQCQREIETILNRYCKENDSNTPDFILATYLMDCLNAFNNAVSLREKWYNSKLEDEIVEENDGAFINSNLFEKEPKLVTVFEIPEISEKEHDDAGEAVLLTKYEQVKEVNVFEDEYVQDETIVSETISETNSDDVNDFWNS